MPADLQRAREVFLHAVGRLPEEQWDDYVTRACGGDAELEQQVKHFLQVHREAGSFLEQPAAGLPATGPIPSPFAFSESPGTIIGPYKLLQQIGEGGMGAVFMAEQTHPVQRKVALKVIKAGLDSRQVIARFEAERQALALMDHPNIARVLDAGTVGEGARDEGRGARENESGSLAPHPSSPAPPSRPSPLAPRPYFVMELVKGVPITKYCDEHHLTLRERLALFVPVCQAVQHAHQKSIIHRDLKPSNVMVCLYDGKPVPKVIDFGVAKAAGPQLTDKTLFTEFGQVLGTLEYMSPEQAEINQLDIDTRSDIYSLGVLLYELLTGTTPLERKRFKAVALLEVLRLIREEEPQKPSTRLSTTEELPSIAANRSLEPKKLSGLVRGELDWIVMKCLEKDRDRRYETANSLALDLEHYLADEPVLAGPPSARYRLRKFVRRHRGAIVVTALLMLMFAALIGSIGWVIRDQAAREGEIRRQAQDSLSAARVLMAVDQPALARQKLAEAKVLIANNPEAFAGLVAEVEAFEMDLARWRRFQDLIDQAHEAEIPNQERLAEMADEDRRSAGPVQLIRQTQPAERQPARAVPFILKALACYEILERDDWITPLEYGLLRKDQIEQIRRTTYEELLWLANDVAERRVDHKSGKQLSPKSAGLSGLAYLQRAAIAHPPTQGFYQLRSKFHKAMGQEEAARADQELADKIPPTTAFDHYQRGQAAYDARNKTVAIKAFEAGLRLEPTHFWSMMRLGYCFADLGDRPEDFSAAVVAFTGCIMKRPDYAHARFCRAIAYRHLGRFEEALADYSKAIVLDPKFASAWSNRGGAYEALEQWDKALADYSKAIVLDPKFASAWNNRGVVYNKVGKWDKALADHSKAIELDPKLAWAWINRGNVYGKVGQRDKALADFSKAIVLDPKFAAAWNNLGVAYQALEQWDKALANYSKAIELDPKFAPWRRNRGQFYALLGRWDKALADYSKAIELDPKLVAAWISRGTVYGKVGQWDKALANYSKAIELDPKFAPWWSNRGVAYQSLGQWDKALADYSKAIVLDPKLTSAWSNRGAAYEALEQWDKALADFSKAIELDPKYAPAWNNRGVVYNKVGKWDKAKTDCFKAIELEPKNASWLNAGAWLLATNADPKGRDPRQAVALAKKAVELAPKEGTYCNTLGTAYYRAGDWQASLSAFEKSAQLRNGGDSFDWFFQAMAHWQLGHKEQARQIYDRAVKWMIANQPNNDELRGFRTEAAKLLGIQD